MKSGKQQEELEKRRAVLVAPEQKEGWRGTHYKGVFVDGIYEKKKDVDARAKIRLMPEVQALVDVRASAPPPQRAT